MRFLWTLLFLVACGAQPSPKFFGAQKHEILRSGRHYVVWDNGREVEVIRLGWAGPRQHDGIRADMLAVIPETTGCRAVDSTVEGDSGVMRARLTCLDRRRGASDPVPPTIRLWSG